MNGAVYPVFGIVFGNAVNAFSQSDPHKRRHDGDRNALYFFIIAILSMIAVGFQNYLFASSAAELTSKLRSLSFRAILRQDIAYFDNVGAGEVATRIQTDTRELLFHTPPLPRAPPRPF